MKDDFPGSLASVGAHRQGNHGSCVEVHDETTIVVRNFTTCSRRLLRSQLRHDWNLPTRTERYHAAVEVGPNSPFYPTPMVRRRDGVKAERPGVVETATSHFPTPPPPPPPPPPRPPSLRLVSHLWWGGACPEVTRGIWWGLSVSQLPRPWRRRRRGVVQLRSRHWFPTSLQCCAEEGRGSFAARHFQRRPSGCALLTHSSPSPSPRSQLGGPGPGPSRQTATTTTTLKEGQRGTSIQAHDGRDTSFFFITVRQTTSQDPRLESKQAAKSQQGEHCRQLARNQTSRRPRTSAISMPEERDPKQRRSLWLNFGWHGRVPLQKKDELTSLDASRVRVFGTF